MRKIYRYLYSRWRRFAFRRAVSRANPKRLILGSGGVPAPAGWIASDVDTLDILNPQDWPGVVDAMLAEHVWEHLADGTEAARMCYEHLNPGGYLRIAVPDGNHPDPAYIDCVKPGGTGAGADDHKWLYTAETLSATLESAGFVVRMLEYWDASGVFHAEDWSVQDGYIERSIRFDPRNTDGRPRYTSLIVDAIKS